MRERVAHRPVHLRHAAQRIGVLHARIVFHMRLSNLTVAQQLTEVRRHFVLAAMRPRGMNPLVEGGRCSFQSFKRHRTGHVGNARDSFGAMQRQSADGRHRLRAVE